MRKKQVTKNMTGPSKNIWIFCTTKEHKSTFFLLCCKSITIFQFRVLWTRLATSIKNDNGNLYKLWCLSACKKWTSSLTSFLGYCEDIANLLLWVLWGCLTIYINNNITLKETLMPKVLKSTLMLICMQKINFISNFLLEILNVYLQA